MLQGPPQIPSPPFDPNMFWANGGAPMVVTIVFLALVATTIVMWPIMRAFGRRLEGKGQGDVALRAEVEQLQQRIGEVDHLHQRVAELEERLDFAERMLARPHAPAVLPGDAPR
jgi:hypothetical protein